MSHAEIGPPPSKWTPTDGLDVGAAREEFSPSWRNGPYRHRAQLRRNGPWIELRGAGLELRARVTQARQCRRPRPTWRVVLAVLMLIAYTAAGVASSRPGVTIAALLFGPVLVGYLLVTEWRARNGGGNGASVRAELVDATDRRTTWWLVPGDVAVWITNPLGTRRAACEIHALLQEAAQARQPG